MESLEVEDRRQIEDESSVGRFEQHATNFWSRITDRLFGSGPNRSSQKFRPLPTQESDDDICSLDSTGVYISHRWCPEEEAGFFSRLFFTWVGGLLKLGEQKALEQHDLWHVAKEDEAALVSEKFMARLTSSKDSLGLSEGRVGRAMWRAHGTIFVLAGMIKLFHDITMFLGPFILEVLLKHIQNKGSRWVGIGLAGALTAANVIETLTVNAYFHLLFRICLHLKTSLIDMLYQKSLNLSVSKTQDMGVGAIVNLQSNDASKLWKLPQYLHMIWSGPFQILAVMGLLIRIIHVWPALVGLGVTVAIIPLSTFVARALARIRKDVMVLTDARVKVSSEVILGIKAIKLYAWEEAYKERILSLREKEMKAIRTAALIGLWNNFLWLGGPIVISMAAFFTYTLMGYELTAAVAFPALSLFNLLRFPVMMFPTQLLNIINGKVALDRIQRFMDSEEVQQATEQQSGDPSISIDRASFYWGPGQDLLLRDINLTIGQGQLVVVIGEVGSGKTSLLSAVLGEMMARTGKVEVRGTIAYTQQEPWILNASLKDNILLGNKFDPTKYAHVLNACALDQDISVLPAGDETEIGEKGVNLSGGQRHRVALARACYASADIYLLDDPLSAVDAHVGRHLMDQCILGLLENTTRILVTHQLHYLPAAHTIVILQDGKIKEIGSFQDLLDKGVDFEVFHLSSEEDNANEGVDDVAPADEMMQAEAIQEQLTENAFEVDEPTTSPATGAFSGDSGSELVKDKEKDTATSHKDSQKFNPAKDLTKAEERAVGQVEKKVYLKYFMAWGPGLLIPAIILGLALGERGLQSGQNWWLSIWSSAMEQAENANSWFYMKIYFSLGLCSLGIQIIRAIVVVLGSLTAAKSLQQSLLSTVLRLPMSFFDSQPTGRLLNRFTRDIEAVDTTLQASVSSFLNCSVSVLWSLIVVVAVSPGIAAAFIPMAWVYQWIQKKYISTSRELKRLDALAMSPIFSHFSETVQGLPVLRAFRAQKRFASKNKTLLNESNRCFWPAQCVNRWLSIRLEMLGTFIVFFAAIFVSGIVPTSAGLAGLSLTSALNLTGLMSWMVRQTTELEVNMNSVERLMEYDEEEKEAPEIVPGHRPLPEWPMRGRIQVEDLVVRYRHDLEPVLHGVSFEVAAGAKVGIVGRTGCGKSTLMMALYRIVEPWSGRVIIDAIDVSTIGLKDLRSRLSLVPQDPIVFSGTIRTNIDPFGVARSDDQLWEVLTQSGLSSCVRRLDGGLDAPIAEGGGNLSSGQRQLLCMARALLRSSKILILDEATSSIDTVTDSVIQSTIATSFKDCTVLTIAHRLHTIMSSDRVLVLDSGRVLEYDSPDTLLRNPGYGAFKSLVEEVRTSLDAKKVPKT